eukprot:7383021-Prymnesium_polylepis.1
MNIASNLGRSAIVLYLIAKKRPEEPCRDGRNHKECHPQSHWQCAPQPYAHSFDRVAGDTAISKIPCELSSNETGCGAEQKNDGPQRTEP